MIKDCSEKIRKKILKLNHINQYSKMIHFECESCNFGAELNKQNMI